MNFNIEAYVLTVDKAGGKRRRAITEEFKRARFKWRFFEGTKVGDPHLRTDYSAILNLLRNNQRVADAELACYASHRSIWRAIADGPSEAALVFEDDARVLDDEALYVALNDLLENISQIDIVKFFDYRPKPIALTRQVGATTLASHKMIATGAVCYLITRDAARKLLAARQRIFRAVDDDWTHAWELGIRIWSVHPNPVTTVEDGSSLIAAGRNASHRERSRLRALWNIILTAHKQIRTANYHRRLGGS